MNAACDVEGLLYGMWVLRVPICAEYLSQRCALGVLSAVVEGQRAIRYCTQYSRSELYIQRNGLRMIDSVKDVQNTLKHKTSDVDTKQAMLTCRSILICYHSTYSG